MSSRREFETHSDPFQGQKRLEITFTRKTKGMQAVLSRRSRYKIHPFGCLSETAILVGKGAIDCHCLKKDGAKMSV
jgi:hypothetical protein